MSKYRALTPEEINVLESLGCLCEDWSQVLVVSNFIPQTCRQVHFSGMIKLGRFEKCFTFSGGVRKKAGIYNATIHNCVIEDDVYISQVKNYIANYHIHEGVAIENVDSIFTEGESCFGNGVKVAVLSEVGGREVMIYNELSAQTAYILAMYRHKADIIQYIEDLISRYCLAQQSTTGHIFSGAHLVNCRTIINVNIGEGAEVEGVYRLCNGTINSKQGAKSYFGPGVIAEDFIAASGSSVSDSTLISKCFVGQGSVLGKHYSAENSIFFANCQGYHGEACSIFAGPYTVSHHKSTLLIAGYYSFMNAGSGSNQSNHMYKLGPIHQGILERGSKTASDSYILWPARIGAFSLIMGRHYRNPDTSKLPFSYLIENGDESILVPGVNLRSIGTIRDARKWPTRDKRSDSKQLDYINFSLLSPVTIQKMIEGKQVLESLVKTSGMTSDYYMYNNVKMSSSGLRRGIALYQIGIVKFLGNSFVNRLAAGSFHTMDELREVLKPTTSIGEGEWVDMAGLLAPKTAVAELVRNIRAGKVTSLSDLDHFYSSCYQGYAEYIWTWCLQAFKEQLNLNILTEKPEELITFVQRWKASVLELDEMVYADARKEFTLKNQTGFGIDGSKETREKDFEEVRGEFERHPAVQDIKKHMRDKAELAEVLIEKLRQLK